MIGRFRALCDDDRRLLLSALALVMVIRIGLRPLPYPRLRAWLAVAARRWPRPDRATTPERIGWAVEMAAPKVPRASCLTRALAAEALLRRHGHEARLRIGVAPGETGGVRAHAWVESCGRIVVGGTELRARDYRPLARDSTTTGRRLFM